MQNDFPALAMACLQIDHEFSLKHDEFEVLIRHPGGDVHQNPYHTELELMKERDRERWKTSA